MAGMFAGEGLKGRIKSLRAKAKKRSVNRWTQIYSEGLEVAPPKVEANNAMLSSKVTKSFLQFIDIAIFHGKSYTKYNRHFGTAKSAVTQRKRLDFGIRT